MALRAALDRLRREAPDFSSAPWCLVVLRALRFEAFLACDGSITKAGCRVSRGPLPPARPLAEPSPIWQAGYQHKPHRMRSRVHERRHANRHCPRGQYR